MPANLYIIGNAGCGKSSLTSAFKNWMEMQGFPCATINLDPGVGWLHYSPDIDVREWLSLDEIMQRFGVGPNGAQIIASDLLAMEMGRVKEAMEEHRVEYFLIDTPGQMELFTLRQSSNLIVDALGGKNSLLLFLLEPTVSKEASGFMALLLQSLSAQFRLDLPLISSLSKADLLSEDEIDRILRWGSDLDALYEALVGEGSATASMSIELFRALESLGNSWALIPSSAETGLGIVDIYSHVQFTLYGSEDLSNE